MKLKGQTWLSAVQSSKRGTRGRDAPWRHKLDASVWDRVQINLKSPLLLKLIPLVPLNICTYLSHIPRHSWHPIPKHIHTSHHRSTHGSLYEKPDWRYADTHKHTHTGWTFRWNNHPVSPRAGPPACPQRRRTIKRAISMWKIDVVTKVHK